MEVIETPLRKTDCTEEVLKHYKDTFDHENFKSAIDKNLLDCYIIVCDKDADMGGWSGAQELLKQDVNKQWNKVQIRHGGYFINKYDHTFTVFLDVIPK